MRAPWRGFPVPRVNYVDQLARNVVPVYVWLWVYRTRRRLCSRSQSRHVRSWRRPICLFNMAEEWFFWGVGQLQCGRSVTIIQCRPSRLSLPVHVRDQGTIRFCRQPKFGPRRASAERNISKRRRLNFLSSPTICLWIAGQRPWDKGSLLSLKGLWFLKLWCIHSKGWVLLLSARKFFLFFT